MYKKSLLPVFLTLLITTLGFGKTALKTFADPPPPKIANYIIGNWNNLMDPRGCVMLDQGHVLKILGKMTIGTNDLTEYPDMFIYTNFTGQSPYTSPAILSSQLEEIELLNGQLVYTYTIEAFNDDFVDECTSDPNVPINFDYYIAVVDANGDPYPIDEFPELLIPTGTPDTGMDPETILYNSTIYAGTKDLCCYGTTGNVGSESRSQNTNDDREIDNSLNTQSAGVYPNPFTNTLRVQFESSQAETAIIQLWDINGRLVQNLEYSTTSAGIHETQINTDRIEPGFYYCNIKTGANSETFKVLKLDR